MDKRNKFGGLTAARFYAAMMIVFLHFGHIGKVQAPTSLGFIGDYFGLGVPLFFTISAFSLCIGYAGRLGSRLELKTYAARRFFRIAPLFYTMMAFYIVYTYLWSGRLIEFGHIVSSALFIFNIVPQYAAGFVSASWSIGTEMLFYFAFPAILLAVTNLRRAAIFFAVAVYISAQWKLASIGLQQPMATFAGYFLAAYLVYFAGGIFGYYLWMRLREYPSLGLPMLLLGIALTVALMTGFSAKITHNTFAALGFNAVTLMVVVIGLTMCPVAVLVNRFTVMMGDASFGLYLIHPVVIWNMLQTGVYGLIMERSASASLAYASCVAVTVIVLFPLAWLSYRYLEDPATRWGMKRMSKWVTQSN